MGIYDRNYASVRDAGAVNTFTNRVYGWMAIGLGLTAFVAYSIYASGAYITLMPFWWMWTFAAFGIAMAINVALRRLSLPAIIALFLGYAAIEGVLFGTILPAFAAAYGGSIIWVAFATAATIFTTAMFYGVFTKSDLTSLGKILYIALIGLIAVTVLFMILSFFIPMQWAHLLISYLGLGIFVGLTAYDAQTIRQFSQQADTNSVASYKLSMVMALKMYINVIMIFWYLLQILSSRGRR